ncbi:hypothetical protein VN97_g839 [Penicillium thymicola]|uniref:Uncharacterized protein n=1 Tax=Penicillium thymicola TaxID=293382 RepID=A0AAI9TS38_PENTH|nr:hypothetical protein VN97_g839 [Penicillium thymicola]
MVKFMSQMSKDSKRPYCRGCGHVRQSTLVMAMRSRWKWNGENTVWIESLARGEEEEKERREPYIEVLSHVDASGIQHLVTKPPFRSTGNDI